MNAIRLVPLLMVAFPPAAAQQPSLETQAESHAAAFDLQDRRATLIIWTIRCAQQVARLRSEGRFGPPESIGTLGHCVPREEGALGVFLKADSAIAAAESVVALNLVTGERHVGPVDTAALLAQSRAARNAVRRGFDAFAAADRPFAPIAMRPRGDSLQVWLLPLDVLAGPLPRALGGERGYLFSPDGGRLVQELDNAGAHRSIEIAAAGPVQLQSTEESIPTVSEMVVANRLSELDRLTSIVTRRYTSSLGGAGENAMWVHIPRQ